MELHYFTFGMGHTYANHVQPIIANDGNTAREMMVQTYGNKWAFHYDEKQWEDNKKRGFGNETVLNLIDARKVVT